MPKSDQGINSDRFMVIPRVLVFIKNDASVLLIKGAPTKRIWANRYNGVGGHIEPGEDVLTAARRELIEEAGITSSGLRLYGTIMVDGGEKIGICIYVFGGNYEGGHLQASAEGQLEWVDVSDLSSYPLVDDLPVILSKVFNMQEQDAPFSARSFYDDQDRLTVVFG